LSAKISPTTKFRSLKFTDKNKRESNLIKKGKTNYETYYRINGGIIFGSRNRGGELRARHNEAGYDDEARRPDDEQKTDDEKASNDEEKDDEETSSPSPQS
jgi:hypothetical protein